MIGRNTAVGIEEKLNLVSSTVMRSRVGDDIVSFSGLRQLAALVHPLHHNYWYRSNLGLLPR